MICNYSYFNWLTIWLNCPCSLIFNKSTSPPKSSPNIYRIYTLYFTYNWGGIHGHFNKKKNCVWKKSLSKWFSHVASSTDSLHCTYTAMVRRQLTWGLPVDFTGHCALCGYSSKPNALWLTHWLTELRTLVEILMMRLHLSLTYLVYLHTSIAKPSPDS